MKEKLALFLSIIGVGMFIVVATASAFEHDWKAIHGEYAATSLGGCLLSYTPPYWDSKLNLQGDPVSNVNTQQAIWTFKAGGTGTVQGTQVGTNFTPHANAGSSKISWKFNYHLKDDGTITTDMIPGTFEADVVQGPYAGATFTLDKISDSGRVSEDHKTITLGTVEASLSTLKYSFGLILEGVCVYSRVLTRLDE